MRQIRQNRYVHKFLFDFYPHDECKGPYWDWTTIILKKVLQNQLKNDGYFLDMGTGPVGVLAIYASLHYKCSYVCAVDHVTDIVASAKKNAEKYKLKIDFFESDLFSNVISKFDLIIFNAPYIDLDTGRKLGVFRSCRDEQRWSGGPGGGKTIVRFLQEAPAYLSAKGRCILGINHYYLSKANTLDFIANSPLKVIYYLENPLTRACAYILERQHLIGVHHG